MNKISSSQVDAIMKAGRTVVPRPRAVCTSNHLDASKLILPEALPTASVDFAAIADSSVGGGGLPRPYGRFSAARNGDGEIPQVHVHSISIEDLQKTSLPLGLRCTAQDLLLY